MIWYKIQASDSDDPLWEVISERENIKLPIVLAVREKLYAQACAIAAGTRNTFYPSAIDRKLGLRKATAERVLAQLENEGFLIGNCLTVWEDMQSLGRREYTQQSQSQQQTTAQPVEEKATSLSSTERSRLCRERKRSAMQRQCSVSAAQCSGGAALNAAECSGNAAPIRCNAAECSVSAAPIRCNAADQRAREKREEQKREEEEKENTYTPQPPKGGVTVSSADERLTDARTDGYALQPSADNSADATLLAAETTVDTSAITTTNMAATLTVDADQGGVDGANQANAASTQTNAADTGSKKASKRRSGKEAPPETHPAREGFDVCWDLWPQKQSKKESWIAYARLYDSGKLPPVEQLVDKIKQLKSQDASWLRGYAPHMSTWLNGERWQDEPRYQKPQRYTQNNQAGAYQTQGNYAQNQPMPAYMMKAQRTYEYGQEIIAEMFGKNRQENSYGIDMDGTRN